MPHLEIRKKGRDKVRRKEWSADAQAITLGRSSAVDVVLHHSAISRHHCTLERVGTNWRIRDHQSRHGVKVNGVRRTEAVLEEGDRVHIGPYELLFHETSQGELGISSVEKQELLAIDESEESSLEDSHVEEGGDAEDLRDEFARIEAALAQAQDDAAAARAESEAAVARQTGEQARELARAAEAAREEVAVRDEKIRSLQEELAVVREQTQSLRAECEARIAESARIADLNRSEGELREVQALRSQLDAATLAREELQLQMSALEQRLEEHVLRAQCAAADSAQQRAEREELIAALGAQLDQALESAEEGRHRLLQAEGVRDSAQAERARLEELLFAERTRADAAREAGTRHEQELAGLNSRINELTGELERAESLRARAMDDLREELAGESLAVQNDRNDMAERLALVTTERDEAMRQRDDLEQRLHDMPDLVQMNKASNGADHSQALERITEIEAALARSEQATHEQEQRLSVARQNIEQFRRAIAEAQKERDVWSTRARLAQAQCDNLKKELVESRQRITAYESLLVDYVTQLQASGHVDAAVVEMSPEEIRRAQRSGATIVELDYPRR